MKCGRWPPLGVCSQHLPGCDQPLFGKRTKGIGSGETWEWEPVPSSLKRESNSPVEAVMLRRSSIHTFLQPLCLAPALGEPSSPWGQGWLVFHDVPVPQSRILGHCSPSAGQSELLSEGSPGDPAVFACSRPGSESRAHLPVCPGAVLGVCVHCGAVPALGPRDGLRAGFN